MSKHVDTLDAAMAADAIAKLMDGTEWSGDTLEAIAAELREAGYVLRDPHDMPEEAEPTEGYADEPSAEFKACEAIIRRYGSTYRDSMLLIMESHGAKYLTQVKAEDLPSVLKQLQELTK